MRFAIRTHRQEYRRALNAEAVTQEFFCHPSRWSVSCGRSCRAVRSGHGIGAGRQGLRSQLRTMLDVSERSSETNVGGRLSFCLPPGASGPRQRAPVRPSRGRVHRFSTPGPALSDPRAVQATGIHPVSWSMRRCPAVLTTVGPPRVPRTMTPRLLRMPATHPTGTADTEEGIFRETGGRRSPHVRPEERTSPRCTTPHHPAAPATL